MYVKFIKLDVPNNTIEVSWYEDSGTSQTSVKCVNYSATQRAEFEAEVEGAASYVRLITWTDPV